MATFSEGNTVYILISNSRIVKAQILRRHGDRFSLRLEETNGRDAKGVCLPASRLFSTPEAARLAIRKQGIIPSARPAQSFNRFDLQK